MPNVETRSGAGHQESLIMGWDYIERGSSEQLAAEALNGLGLNLQISREDLRIDGHIRETGGVIVRGTSDKVEVFEKLLRSPKGIVIRLAEGGWGIDEDELSEANFDPKTETQMRAYSLHWDAIRKRRGANASYVLNNSIFARDVLEIDIANPVHKTRSKERRDHEVQESYQMTKKAREILGDIKPLGRNGLIAIFKQEAKTLYPKLADNPQSQA